MVHYIHGVLVKERQNLIVKPESDFKKKLAVSYKGQFLSEIFCIMSCVDVGSNLSASTFLSEISLQFSVQYQGFVNCFLIKIIF